MKYTYYRRKKRIKFVAAFLCVCLLAAIAAGGVSLILKKGNASSEVNSPGDELLIEGCEHTDTADDEEQEKQQNNQNQINELPEKTDDRQEKNSAREYLYLLKKVEIPAVSELYNRADIRIFYPDGTSYMVVADAEATGTGEAAPGLMVHLSEEELLRLLCAEKDTELFAGSYLFATLHNGNYYGLPDYTPSIQVIDRICSDPNIGSAAGQYLSKEERGRIEERLLEWAGTVTAEYPETDISDGNFDFRDTW